MATKADKAREAVAGLLKSVEEVKTSNLSLDEQIDSSISALEQIAETHKG